MELFDWLMNYCLISLYWSAPDQSLHQYILRATIVLWWVVRLTGLLRSYYLLLMYLLHPHQEFEL